MPGPQTGAPAPTDGEDSRRDDRLIERAARRTGLAGSALTGAAGDLGHAHGDDGRALAGLAEVVREEAVRIGHLAEDIESHRPESATAPARRWP